tara:strand:+ start:492 stop:728 length:237 start_codon:yes stop_codon:yes gene_type:complete
MMDHTDQLALISAAITKNNKQRKEHESILRNLHTDCEKLKNTLLEELRKEKISISTFDKWASEQGDKLTKSGIFLKPL